MSWYPRLVSIISTGSAVAAFGAYSGTPDENHGFPALAVASFNVAADQVPALRKSLKKFAKAEDLTFLQDGFWKNGRQVSQFYLRKHSQPVVYIDNVRDALRFEASAYSLESESAWKPRWLRLLSVLGSSE
jgi:hypothetical protein